jgi:hypothetical protein
MPARRHIPGMDGERNIHRQDGKSEDAWRVVDDFPQDIPVGDAELDAVEAFLMPLVRQILGETPGGNSLRPSDSTAPQRAALRKR